MTEQGTKQSAQTCFNPDVEKGKTLKPNEQDANHADESTPYDENTLYRMAEAAATQEKVPHRWREDAVAEYVARAWRAGQQAKNRSNIRGYQCCMGHGALRHFLLREQRQEALAPKYCNVAAKRVTLDKMITLRDGERVAMVETIVDENAEQPDARMLREERDQAVRRALRRLSPEERQAFKLVVLEGKTQEKTLSARPSPVPSPSPWTGRTSRPTTCVN